MNVSVLLLAVLVKYIHYGRKKHLKCRKIGVSKVEKSIVILI